MCPDSETAASHAPEALAAAAACAWCGAPLHPGPQGGFETVPCTACGSRTTWPIPTDADLELAYGSWYRPDHGRFSGLGDRILRSFRGRLARRLDVIAPPGPILDVGAGDGALLDALASNGRKAVGLERRSARPDIREAELTEIEDEFAAIVFWHSLEHLRDAGAALNRAAELIAPGGVVVVAMPNLDSLQAEAFGDHWFALDLPRHLVHVPAPALLARLEELELEPIRVSHLRGGQVVFGWLQGIVGSLPGDLDLYDAIRRPEARRRPISGLRRAAALIAGCLALPVSMAAALVEAGMRRGGTVYVEARRG
jgi:SAM-dependent methyltransferase